MTPDDTAQAWVSSALRTLSEATWAQADLDEVPGGTVTRAAAREAVELFRSIVARVAETAEPLVSLLVLPLPASARLVTRHPDVEAFLRRPWSGVQVPGFYLLRFEHLALWDGFEEYRVPVAYDIGAAEPVHCYYRACRDPHTLAQGWEYDRSFVFRTDAARSSPP